METSYIGHSMTRHLLATRKEQLNVNNNSMSNRPILASERKKPGKQNRSTIVMIMYFMWRKLNEENGGKIEGT